MVKKPRLYWLHPLILVALIKISVSCIADDEFLCEEAVAYLDDCCPDQIRGKIDCSSEWEACTDFRCDPHFTKITLDAQESRCILDKSCDALRPSTCAAIGQSPSTSTSTSRDTVVCR